VKTYLRNGKTTGKKGEKRTKERETAEGMPKSEKEALLGKAGTTSRDCNPCRTHTETEERSEKEGVTDKPLQPD